MAEREKGVATIDCPQCGKSLPMEEQADGSLAASRCSQCHPKAERAEKSQPRERATNVEEQK